MLHLPARTLLRRVLTRLHPAPTLRLRAHMLHLPALTRLLQVRTLLHRVLTRLHPAPTPRLRARMLHLPALSRLLRVHFTFLRGGGVTLLQLPRAPRRAHTLLHRVLTRLHPAPTLRLRAHMLHLPA